jgi:hypothetical protein
MVACLELADCDVKLEAGCACGRPSQHHWDTDQVNVDDLWTSKHVLELIYPIVLPIPIPVSIIEKGDFGDLTRWLPVV